MPSRFRGSQRQNPSSQFTAVLSLQLCRGFHKLNQSLLADQEAAELIRFLFDHSIPFQHASLVGYASVEGFAKQVDEPQLSINLESIAVIVAREVEVM